MNYREAHAEFKYDSWAVETDERRMDFCDAAKAQTSLKASRKEKQEPNIDLDGQMYGPGISD